jgi:hypothetical protein
MESYLNLDAVSSRRASLAALLGLASLAALRTEGAWAQAPVQPGAALSPEQAAQDVRVLRRALLELHPGRTKYQSEDDWKRQLARFETRGNAARTPAEMLLAVAEFTASLRCGHTWPNHFNQKGALRRLLMESADKLPFTLALVEGRWLVLNSADAAVAKGDEVLAINGLAAADIVAQLWPYLRADGASDEKRRRQLGHDRLDASPLDLLWPLISPPAGGRWAVTLRRAGGPATVSVAATTLAARAEQLTARGAVARNDTWSLRIEARQAVMRLPTFAFFDGRFDWKAWLQQAFTDLQAKSVEQLVIDIRDLEGGDDRIGLQLLGHLLERPWRFTSDQAVTVYERVPYILARHLETWNYDFFDRTGQVERLTAGPQQGLYVVKARQRGERSVVPVAPAFRGKVFLLVSGENSSAGFQLAWMVQQSRAATLVGQPTGGNLRGLNAGELAFLTLPHSGVVVDIPLLAHLYAADTPDRSVQPDIVVRRSFEAQRAGRDEEMDAVRQASR